ncbi:ShlB/FhaC/HecB family hemolysin secretion/activation protein [Glaesserella parasuis]|uniref:ShlB/FhaC/HecB family hemolysin secretion/activation protein n=1 Tax=Glaesserella parasuis TaxID=738 RepID=UPI00094FBD91|nr:ShlB/FhaC/HecB family hemolysin secretion/activation protein [Glaesserella parasuis]MDG4923378.1 ShlB/FhaC/HecB family hemolysin secretion/activation protein [Glaesserella parasuis]MDG6227303.1 ShlB/FhaC/HecB family hemolysin secretion/activation protein [Glaesserella parasuis]MDG6233256.1 ShlB/FhaC/HecB family hemolysin secretion/activation protein [Glaesserella parasuis]MDG6261513.1 ShlB/FhaC/HecB family hemolysin secretion/activation protein [Glaesserella parasuis]MDG6322929.1 ShlB/FhaC/
MKHFHRKNVITGIILSCVAGFTYANPMLDSGTLNKQLEQTRQMQAAKVKPSGELFKTPTREENLPANEESLKFRLDSVKLLELDGNEIKDNLTSITAPYLHQEITLDDLNRLAQQITNYYRDNNYLVAKAFIPPQEINNGELQIFVIKGALDQVVVRNGSRLKEDLVMRMVNTTVKSHSYLVKNELEKLALLLNDIKGITSALSLKAGQYTGKTDLTVNLKDNKRWNGYISIDNQGNDNTGKYRTTLGNKIYNLVGLGDELHFDVLASNTFDLYNLRADYSFIIDGYGTRVGINSNYLKYKLGANFKDLNAQGSTYNLGGYITHPTIRTASLRLDSKLAFNHQKLSDEQKSVDLQQKRKVNTTSIGLGGSWNSIKEGVTYFSFNTIFGKESHSTNEKKHYLSENYQPKRTFTTFNYSLSHEQFLPKSFSITLAVSGQLTDKNLDSGNKFLLGGLSGVKGYQAGTVSVDEGHIIQAELKHYLPVFSKSMLVSSLFYDEGFGKQYKNTEKLSESVENKVRLKSIGVGLNLIEPNHYSINLAYSKPIGKKYNNVDKNQFWLSAIKTF